MSRKLRTNQTRSIESNGEKVKEKGKCIKELTKNFDEEHGARERPPLQPGETVWIPETQSSGMVVNQHKPGPTKSKRVEVFEKKLQRPGENI